MNSSSALSNSSVYTDFASLSALRGKARTDQAEARGEVARQFESLFLQMMLKSMRQASLAEGLFDSQSLQKYRDMYDQQLALHLSNSGGIGLAEVIEQQLAGNASHNGKKNLTLDDYWQMPIYLQAVKPAQDKTNTSSAAEVVNDIASIEASIEAGVKTDIKADGENLASSDAKNFDGSIQSFVERLKPYAMKAASMLGLQPEALLAQAALETGWGKLQMKLADGSPSHNLFGIKADLRWDGRQADVSTLEYRDGVAQRERASFRAYDSYEQAFNDYAAFIQNNPRYRHALRQVADPQAYFAALQQAGYATDPAYANKVMTIFRQGDIQAAMTAAPQPDEEG